MSPKENGKRAKTSRNRDANVLAAAIKVISEKGYAATSIQEVADRVGVLKGSLYHYFDSKEELLFRILAESHTAIRELQEEIKSKNLEPFDELLEYIRHQTIWYLDNRDRANIYFAERRHLTGERRQRALEAGKSFEKYIQDLVIHSQEAGKIRNDLDYRLITRFLTGSLNGVRYWTSRSGKQFTHEEIADASVALIRNATGAQPVL